MDAVSSLDESLGDEESSSSVVEGAPNAVVSLLSRLKSRRARVALQRKEKSRLILLQASVLVVDQQLLNRRALQPIRELKNSQMSPYVFWTGNYSATLEWWRRNCGDIQTWSSCAQKVMLVQPSSAASELVILQASFLEQQDNSLQDYIEPSLMYQYNKH